MRYHRQGINRADRIVEEAESLAADLVAEARREADGILATARAEAAELGETMAAERERLRSQIEGEVRAGLEAEIADQTRQAARLLDRTEADLRDVTPLLQDALAQVGTVLGSFGTLRGEVPSDPSAPDVLDEPLDELEAPAPRVEEARVDDAPEPETSDSALGDDARPLGWLFRSSQG